MLCMLYAELLLFQNTGITEKGLVMATTNETMKVIAEGIGQKKSPDIIMDGRVIVIEIPDEMEEIFRDLAGSLVGRCDKTIEKRLEAEDDDEDWKNNETGELASRIAAVLAHRAVDNLNFCQWTGKNSED